METRITLEQAQEKLLRIREAARKEEPQERKPEHIQSTLSVLSEKYSVEEEVCHIHGSSLPCPMCAARQQEAFERCERIARERREHPEPIMRLCGIKQRYLSCSFESFQGGGGITTECLEFLGKPQDIVLVGGPGNGKTHLAVAIIRELVKELKINGPQDCIFITVPDLLLEIRSTFGEESSSEKEIVEKYSSVPYLVLDDIGAEKSTEWSITTLYLIIGRRTSEELPTIYTTNLSLEEIDTKLSSRIASRMAYAKVLKNGMPDYRRKRASSLHVLSSYPKKGAGPP